MFLWHELITFDASKKLSIMLARDSRNHCHGLDGNTPLSCLD